MTQRTKHSRLVIQWLLDSDPAIRWQVMRDLTEAPANEVATERAKVAAEGWGARLLSLQGSDGRWGGAAWNRGWDSTMHVLMLLRDLGLDPTSEPARRAVSLVRERVTWQGCGPQECDNNSFFEGEIEPCINGQVGTVGAYFGQDDVVRAATRGIIDHLLTEQLTDGGWNCEALNGSTAVVFQHHNLRAGGTARVRTGRWGKPGGDLPPVCAGRSTYSSGGSSGGGRPAR